MADDAILRKIEEQMRRGNQLMAEVREEHHLNRRAYAEGIELMSAVVVRNGEAFQGLIAELGRFRERIDAFGATLDLQREILLRFLDRLDNGTSPPQG